MISWLIRAQRINVGGDFQMKSSTFLVIQWSPWQRPEAASDQSLAQAGACYQGVGLEKLLLGGRAGPVPSFPSHHTPECPLYQWAYRGNPKYQGSVGIISFSWKATSGLGSRGIMKPKKTDTRGHGARRGQWQHLWVRPGLKQDSRTDIYRRRWKEPKTKWPGGAVGQHAGSRMGDDVLSFFTLHPMFIQSLF